MALNQEVRDYFFNLKDQMTEEWYDTLEEKDPDSVYASTNPEVIRNLKQQNTEFNGSVCNMFIEDEEEFFKEFDKWILAVARDNQHAATPIHNILREFMRVREQYIHYLMKFVDDTHEQVDRCQENSWLKLINRVFDITITKFVEEYYKNSKKLLAAQQEMINELSSPIITLKHQTALLPLVGDIDTQRARIIMENTLLQCAKKEVNHLFIDLSGVVMVDTMVANEIFQLIEALKLIGVQSTLSGIRPEIAVTAMQLGLSFDTANITATLTQAILKNEAEERSKS
ncbi:STAS domain-containing protein [Bacillus testis]|uniref:STAS domain-containing protein n=1 Tax=Bacillus testis TaxID=1622072 RepID=UPI00067E7A49|nr:STAS domain-containing protein [Bacillus testis]